MYQDRREITSEYKSNDASVHCLLPSCYTPWTPELCIQLYDAKISLHRSLISQHLKSKAFYFFFVQEVEKELERQENTAKENEKVSESEFKILNIWMIKNQVDLEPVFSWIQILLLGNVIGVMHLKTV